MDECWVVVGGDEADTVLHEVCQGCLQYAGLRRCILDDLANRKPWNKIAKQYHVSAKTINKYRKESASVSKDTSLTGDDWRILYNLQGVLGAKTITSAISEAFNLCLQVTPYVKMHKKTSAIQ